MCLFKREIARDRERGEIFEGKRRYNGIRIRRYSEGGRYSKTEGDIVRDI